ncbi:hypothetical protein D7D52_07935 [Nocardia yunnanensis]|uniref:DUF8020 domain-containing protein n=1 Tax=Nocardia yunnanensis TaxID=2382165 RepID=A0A386Z9G3_9NOCA|nr:hypothetical protein [Nocardia yunnanensis]AYF73803.1 hypothetical protein D7D52_07935 [Nocardia yunnanensis]
MRNTAAASALLAATLCIGAGVTGTAQANPAETIDYTATDTGTSTIVRTDAGSMTVEDGVFKIKAANGTVLAGTELSFRVDDFVFPIAADISGRTATLTPQFDEAHAVYQPVALPYEDQAPWKTQYDREQAAWGRMRDTISVGATIGTLVGGLAGAGLGCLAGAAVGATLTGALALLFGAGPLAGCVAGAAAVGFLGTIAGQIFVTAPVAIAAAIQYFTTINQPFTPAK